MLFAINQVGKPKSSFLADWGWWIAGGGMLCVLFTLAVLALGVLAFVLIRRRRMAMTTAPVAVRAGIATVVTGVLDLVEAKAREDARAARIAAEQQLAAAKRAAEQLLVSEHAKSLGSPVHPFGSEIKP